MFGRPLPQKSICKDELSRTACLAIQRDPAVVVGVPVVGQHLQRARVVPDGGLKLAHLDGTAAYQSVASF